MLKKLVLGALVAVAGYVGYRKYQAGQAEQDLWSEATDPVQPAGTR